MFTIRTADDAFKAAASLSLVEFLAAVTTTEFQREFHGIADVRTGNELDRVAVLRAVVPTLVQAKVLAEMAELANPKNGLTSSMALSVMLSQLSTLPVGSVASLMATLSPYAMGMASDSATSIVAALSSTKGLDSPRECYAYMMQHMGVAASLDEGRERFDRVDEEGDDNA